MPTIDATIDQPPNRASKRTAAGFGRAAALIAIVLLNLTALMGTLGASPASAADGVSLHIAVPAPAGGVASGPVGANVSVSGVGVAHHTYQLGYATKEAGCGGANAFQPLSTSTVTPQKDGTFSANFEWPSSAGTRNASYYVCAQDQGALANPLVAPIQSAETFKVLATSAPSIAVDAAPSPNATPIPTTTDGSYYANSRIEITGTNFLPRSATLQAYVTTSASFSPADAQNYKPLAQDSGSASFNADSNGSFVKIVTLPLFPQGAVYLHVVSTDFTSSFPPALDADQQITLGRALPTATPSSPTPSPSVAATASTTAGTGPGGNQSQPVDPANVLAVVGLSGLSIILFIVGIILMTSASAMPRSGPR
jgi:hypothetical protein